MKDRSLHISTASAARADRGLPQSWVFDFSRVDIGDFNSGIMGVCHDIEERETVFDILERIRVVIPA